MREAELRTILLVKAIEDSDPEGAVIASADRTAAAREAVRGVADSGVPAPPADGMALAPLAQRQLLARAQTLLARIVARYPFVDNVLALLGSSTAVTLVLVGAGLLLGGALSALDGSRRINVLAFPLLGIVAWNLAVYAVLLLVAVRPAGASRSALRGWVAATGASFASRLIARSRTFNAPLATALDAFAREWFAATRPLLLARAARAFHLAAAAVGVGLVAGLYLRGIAFDYHAGWESTFLDATRARGLLTVLYGPASWLTGIPVPDVAHLEAMRWRDGAGGESAARWIHLMAASALLYVVLPRLVLAAASAAAAIRLSLRAPLPATLPPYFRAAFNQIEGAAARATAIILPFACELTPDALARLIAWVPGAVGGNVGVQARASVPYGEEERYLATLGESANAADVVVLPFSLAATPEDENHGTVLAGVRDWLATHRPNAQLLVVIDEASYSQRMAGSPERLAERREVWRRFIEARALKPAFLSLAP